MQLCNLEHVESCDIEANMLNLGITKKITSLVLKFIYFLPNMHLDIGVLIDTESTKICEDSAKFQKNKKF